MSEFQHLKLWVYPSHYAGADLSDWYPVVGKHRDSGPLDRSNFDAAWARLRAVPGADWPAAKLRTRWYQDDRDGEVHEAVMSTSFGNPLVGWSETIFVHKDAAAAVLAEAESILDDLEGYPALDEDAWSELEDDEAFEWWQEMGLANRVEMCREAGISIFAARRTDGLPEDPYGHLYERLRSC